MSDAVEKAREIAENIVNSIIRDRCPHKPKGRITHQSPEDHFFDPRCLSLMISEAITQARQEGFEEGEKKFQKFLKRYEKVMNKFDLFYAHELEDTIDCLEARAQEYETAKEANLRGYNLGLKEGFERCKEKCLRLCETSYLSKRVAQAIEALSEEKK